MARQQACGVKSSPHLCLGLHSGMLGTHLPWRCCCPLGVHALCLQQRKNDLSSSWPLLPLARSGVIKEAGL